MSADTNKFANELAEVLEKMFGEKQNEIERSRKADTRYVYDNIRPSVSIEPDKDVWIKREEIVDTIVELINVQGHDDPRFALSNINDPNTVTKTPNKDEYGLTDGQSKYLLNFIFCVEGGYFNHPNDPGGETMYGIIKTEARKWGYDGKMRDLPREVAIEIYKKKYWKGTGLMNIKNFAVALTIFDFQVNSGIRGAKIAQKTANRLYQNRNEEETFKKAMEGTFPLSEDGALGPKSFEVINKIPPLEFLMSYNVFQEDQYEDLMRNNSKLRVFDEGWENRMIKKNIYIGAMFRNGVVDLEDKE